jgi:hypothetical protein
VGWRRLWIRRFFRFWWWRFWWIWRRKLWRRWCERSLVKML